MKTIIGAIALTFAVPVVAQTAPAANAPAHHSLVQAGQQQGKHSMEDMHKACQDMMKHHGKMLHGVKSEGERADAEVNGNEVALPEP